MTKSEEMAQEIGQAVEKAVTVISDSEAMTQEIGRAVDTAVAGRCNYVLILFDRDDQGAGWITCGSNVNRELTAEAMRDQLEAIEADGP